MDEESLESDRRPLPMHRMLNYNTVIGSRDRDLDVPVAHILLLGDHVKCHMMWIQNIATFLAKCNGDDDHTYISCPRCFTTKFRNNVSMKKHLDNNMCMNMFSADGQNKWTPPIRFPEKSLTYNDKGGKDERDLCVVTGDYETRTIVDNERKIHKVISYVLQLNIDDDPEREYPGSTFIEKTVWASSMEKRPKRHCMSPLSRTA